MNKYIKIIKYFLLLLSLSSFVVLFSPIETFKDFGNYSWYLLILVMFIRPLKDMFPKCKILSFILKFRRELGILVGMFGLAHVIGYIKISEYPNIFGIFIDEYVWNYSGTLFWGMLGILVAIPLLITSNGWFTSLLGKYWKTLQRLSYFMFLFVGIHIFLIKGEKGPLVMVGIWLIVWIGAFIKNKKANTIVSKGPKWLCVPCGYIYDENIGDIDSGILPGTKFEDIPDTWVCPVCGVGKSDFILLEEEIEISESEIVGLEYLNSGVIELKIDVKKDLDFVSGQFLTFHFKDNAGEFNRSYSIVNKQNNIFTFLIKLKLDGRAGKIFKTLKKGNKISYTSISGTFHLQDTSNPKVFIATGTGLAPIYSMLENTKEDISKKLYFGVANLEDMFYEEKLKEIKNLEINLYLSREKVNGYNFGRINLENIEFEKNCEFYICGNPGLVEATKKVLAEKGFMQIFSEEF